MAAMSMMMEVFNKSKKGRCECEERVDQTFFVSHQMCEGLSRCHVPHTDAFIQASRHEDSILAGVTLNVVGVAHEGQLSI